MVNFVQFVAYFVSNTPIPAHTIWFQYSVPKSDIEYLAARYVAYTMALGTSESDPGALFRNASKVERSQKVRTVVEEWERTHPDGSLNAYVPYGPLDAAAFSEMIKMDIGTDYAAPTKAKYVQHVVGTSAADSPTVSTR